VEHKKDVKAAEHHLSDLDVCEPLDTNTSTLTIVTATIQSSRLIIALTDSPKPLPPPESLVFGKVQGSIFMGICSRREAMMIIQKLVDND